MILKAKFLKMTLRGFFLSFRNSFFHYYQVNLGAIWYLNKYKKQKKQKGRGACGALFSAWGALFSACGTSRHPKTLFYHVIRSVVMSFY
jgi:hypothetical protein